MNKSERDRAMGLRWTVPTKDSRRESYRALDVPLGIDRPLGPSYNSITLEYSHSVLEQAGFR